MAKPKKAKRAAAMRGLPARQSTTAPPVITAPHLPMMEKVDKVKTALRNARLPLMGSGVPTEATGSGFMKAVERRGEADSGPERTPQRPKGDQQVSGAGEGYVRINVRVENDKLSVLGMKPVPGPLAMPSGVVRGYVYEVLLEGQQVALGSVPDVGVRRSFTNRDVRGPEGKHHFSVLPRTDFVVRLPMSHFSREKLPNLHIVLHNVREAPDRLTTLTPLKDQPGVETEEVARLSGIDLRRLEPGLRARIGEILPEPEKL